MCVCCWHRRATMVMGFVAFATLLLLQQLFNGVHGAAEATGFGSSLSRTGDAKTGECTDVADVVVWGGTVCGATAVVAASRTFTGNTTSGARGRSIVWLVNGSRLGGMSSGGLGGLDHGEFLLLRAMASSCR